MIFHKLINTIKTLENLPHHRKQFISYVNLDHTIDIYIISTGVNVLNDPTY